MPTQTVELFGDLSCPWCYLGFRRLRRLQRERSLRVRWRPFLLNPHLPPEGVERHAYGARKFGSAEAARRLDQRLATLGEREGIAFAFDRMRRISSTVAAQGLLLEAQRRGVAETMLERLFAAYFVDGRDLGEAALLRDLAAQLGLSWDWPGGRAPPPGSRAVLESHRQACDAGISGVPLLVFDAGLSIAGAQPLEALRGIADLAAMRARQEGAAVARSYGRQAS
jgi:predicted DsbA family dithiol-disulfide isomerase